MMEIKVKKTIIAWLTILLLLSSLIISSENASAQLWKPIYHKGDYWEYSVSAFVPDDSTLMQGISRTEISDEATITVGGKNYEVWKVVTTVDATSDDGEWESHYYLTSYWLKSNYATIKEILDSETITPYSGIPLSSHTEMKYKPPYYPEILYPIDVGNKWELHKEGVLTHETGTIDGYTLDFYYECTGIAEEVKTDAGTFSCYVIKTMNNSENTGRYRLEYYSNKVGYFVKAIEYEHFEQKMLMKLKSYRYQSKNEDGGIPSFELTILIIAIASSVLMKRKRDKNERIR